MRGSETLDGADRMRTGARLALYGLGLVLVFGGAFGIAGAVAPAGTATAWVKGTEMNDHDQGHSSASAAPTAGAADAADAADAGQQPGCPRRDTQARAPCP